MEHPHDLEYLSVRLIYTGAHPFRLALLDKARLAVTGRTRIATGVTPYALAHLFRKIGPALLHGKIFKFVNAFIFSLHIGHRRGRLTDHHIRYDRVVEPAGQTIVGKHIPQRDILSALFRLYGQAVARCRASDHLFAIRGDGYLFIGNKSRTGNPDNNNLITIILFFLKVDYQRPGGTSPGHDADNLFRPLLRLGPLLRFLVPEDNIMNILCQIDGTEPVPDKSFCVFGIRYETGCRLERKRALFISYNDIRLAFGKQLFCVFLHLFFYIFHSCRFLAPVI